MTTILGKVRLLRTTSSAIESTVLEEGRLVYLTDEKSLVSGDGSTIGSGLPRIGSIEYNTNPSLGADLDLNGYSITNTHNSGIFNIGSGNILGSDSLCFGKSNTVSGNNNLCLGNANISSNNNNICLGNSNTCSNENAIAIGNAVTSLGNTSIAIGGTFCIASGVCGVAIGGLAITNADYAFAVGFGASANRYGMMAHSNGSFGFLGYGEAQEVDFVLRKKTTNATLTTLMLDGNTTRLTITNGRALFGTAIIAGIKSDGSSCAMYMRKFGIKNVGGTTSLIGSVETIGTDVEDDADWGVQVTADDTNDALDIAVSGEASTTVRWVAHVHAVEIKYGT